MHVEAVNSITSGDQLEIRQPGGHGIDEKAQGMVPQRPDEVLSRGDKGSEPDCSRTPLVDLLQENEYDITFQLSFTVHKETEQLVVKVIDPHSNRVIREIPPEELLDLAVRLQEMLGFLIDRRV